MKVETKVNLYSTLFFSLIFGALFTIIGGLITSGTVDWPHFPITVLAGALTGLVVGLIIPIGKISSSVAGKIAKPSTFFFNLVMYAVLLIVILLFMCPILTVFIGSVLMGAPVMAVLPSSFSLFIPFFAIGLVLLMIIGKYVMMFAMKCAGLGAMITEESN